MDNSLYGISTVDLIKIVSIKKYTHDSTPIYRIFKRHNLKKAQENITSEFINNRDIFDQADALYSVLKNMKNHDINNNKAHPEYVGSIDEFVSLESTDMVIKLNNGKLKYSPISRSFIVDINKPLNENDKPYTFVYDKSSSKIDRYNRLWSRDVLDNLKYIFIRILIYITNINNLNFKTFDK